MKKFIIFFALLSAAVSCSMFELDNFEGPNAEVTGNLYDMVTGEKLSIEADDEVFDEVVQAAVKCIAKVEPDCRVILK